MKIDVTYLGLRKVLCAIKFCFGIPLKASTFVGSFIGTKIQININDFKVEILN